jgi:hypothetical protein
MLNLFWLIVVAEQGVSEQGEQGNHHPAGEKKERRRRGHRRPQPPKKARSDGEGRGSEWPADCAPCIFRESKLCTQLAAGSIHGQGEQPKLMTRTGECLVPEMRMHHVFALWCSACTCATVSHARVVKGEAMVIAIGCASWYSLFGENFMDLMDLILVGAGTLAS